MRYTASSSYIASVIVCPYLTAFILVKFTEHIINAAVLSSVLCAVCCMKCIQPVKLTAKPVFPAQHDSMMVHVPTWSCTNLAVTLYCFYVYVSYGCFTVTFSRCTVSVKYYCEGYMHSLYHSISMPPPT